MARRTPVRGGRLADERHREGAGVPLSRGGGLRLTFGLVGFALALAATAASASTLWLVSAERAALRPGERIVGFELTVTSGRIAALPAIPVGWSVAVENHPTWRTQVTGAILIGAAALDPGDLRDFVVVEAYDSEGGRFDVTLILTVTADFRDERRIHLSRDLLGLRRR
jgi:hypothetical protein